MAIKNQETETILAYLEDFVSRNGMPRSILTNQSKQNLKIFVMHLIFKRKKLQAIILLVMNK